VAGVIFSRHLPALRSINEGWVAGALSSGTCAVGDYIAGMTDRFCLKMLEEI